ncbi:MAG: hypothetical protein HOH43_27545 [Candidatus Latescibacteria bacterium]|nr:hypothetical protein [Candidatus Latescibacterota bacterium]
MFVNYIPLPVEAGGAVSAQIYAQKNGDIRITIDTSSGRRVHLTTDSGFDVLREAPTTIAIENALKSSDIQSWDSDQDFYWVATKTGLHRIRQDIISADTETP